MNGKEWKEYFEKQDTRKLKKLEAALSVVLSDAVIKKEFGDAAGLSWVKHFITMTLMDRESPTQRKIVGTFGAKKRR